MQLEDIFFLYAYYISSYILIFFPFFSQQLSDRYLCYGYLVMDISLSLRPLISAHCSAGEL